MTTVRFTKESDGSTVYGSHEDFGDTVPAFDAEGLPVDAWTEKFVIEGKELVVQTWKRHATGARQRFAEVVATVYGHGFLFDGVVDD